MSQLPHHWHRLPFSCLAFLLAALATISRANKKEQVQRVQSEQGQAWPLISQEKGKKKKLSACAEGNTVFAFQDMEGVSAAWARRSSPPAEVIHPTVTSFIWTGLKCINLLNSSELNRFSLGPSNKMPKASRTQTRIRFYSDIKTVHCCELYHV